MIGQEILNSNSVIVRKWYQALAFPDKYDKAFEALASEIQIPEDVDTSTYQFSHRLEDGGRNLILCLYFCESLEKKYIEKGISLEILYDTLGDIVYWTGIHYELTGKLGISEVDWIKRHLSMQLFRLGRLQFCFGKCHEDIEEIGAAAGDRIIEVHIPAGEALESEKCKEALERARRFFKEHFPKEEYKCFTCSSWLLDDTLINFMKESANIIQFQRMFTLVSRKESYDVLKYSIGWNVSKETLRAYKPVNSFTERVMNHIFGGGVFYSGYGFIKK